MPGVLAHALAAPLHDLRELVGTGWTATDAPVAALTRARAVLTGIAESAAVSWVRVADGWAGAAAVAAGGVSTTTVAAARALADRAGLLGDVAHEAGSAVTRAQARLDAIIENFEQRAAALEPRLGQPGVAEELLTEAQNALREAVAVVAELRAELDRQSTVMTSAPAATPEGFSGAGAALPTAGWSGLAAGPGSGLSGARAPVFSAPETGLRELRDLPDAAAFGDGVAVRLPDGSTAMAPNAVAASAVRHALTQLGVPYHWGGTTPGVGLDCSGLTQWAYREAGLSIPRLAQEQDVGVAVAANAVRPGDLAVWDGHVAMIVAPDTMIEAGDPVQLSPIRTTNAGQGFQGFWRPTA
ncbi:C40 family peptidase [Mycolicibacterium goodii]|uniref:C40 family peptidase n=1 Tax=Mycolicibacterium goodii TaxID=134601 RepID=UPI001BDCE0E3|nr:C40 family peptidase [Mycolicibacterium goodii]MBU8810092.1 C40 family peptidase [Mycolicibacterium goodii]